MRRFLAVIILVALSTGCVTSLRPSDQALRLLQTIAVIPLADYSTVACATCAMRELPLPGGVGGVAALVVIVSLAMVSHAAKSAGIPDDGLILETGLPKDREWLTVQLAQVATETLRVDGARAAYLVDGYLRLPMADPAASPVDVQFEVQTRFRRWFRETMARVDYRAVSMEGVDAVLEVGVSSPAFRENALTVLVWVRLVNPSTKTVLGRVVHRTVMTKGRETLLQSLRDLGLLAE